MNYDPGSNELTIGDTTLPVNRSVALRLHRALIGIVYRNEPVTGMKSTTHQYFILMLRNTDDTVTIEVSGSRTETETTTIENLTSILTIIDALI